MLKKWSLLWTGTVFFSYKEAFSQLTSSLQTQVWEGLHTASCSFLICFRRSRLKTIDVVIRNAGDAEEALQSLESRLRDAAKVPASEPEVEEQRGQLKVATRSVRILASAGLPGAPADRRVSPSRRCAARPRPTGPSSTGCRTSCGARPPSATGRAGFTANATTSWSGTSGWRPACWSAGRTCWPRRTCGCGSCSSCSAACAATGRAATR